MPFRQGTEMIQLREFRRIRGITQKKAAEELGLLQSTYNQYETGKREPDSKTMIRLADYYGVTVDALLGNEGKADVYFHAANGLRELELSDDDMDRVMEFAKSLKTEKND